MSDKDNQKYKGPSDIVVGWGQSQVDSLVGTIAGAAAGAATGAIAHNKEKHVQAQLASETKFKVFLDKIKRGVESAVDGSSESWKTAAGTPGVSSEALETAERFYAENKGFKALWHSMSRGGKAIVTAIAGAAVVGTIAQMTGWVRGAKKSKAAREQFEEISAENAALRQGITAAQAQLDQSKSFVDALHNERGKSAETVRGT